jgi:hypothetical protein
MTAGSPFLALFYTTPTQAANKQAISNDLHNNFPFLIAIEEQHLVNYYMIHA